MSLNTATALLLLLIAPLFLAASPPPIDGSFCSNVKETLQLNGTFAKPKRFRVCIDVRTMQARRDEESAEGRPQITLYNATFQLVLIPHSSGAGYDCIKLDIPSSNATEPFSYAVVDKEAVLINASAALPIVGVLRAEQPIGLWAHNRTYTGGMVQLLEWYLQEEHVPGAEQHHQKVVRVSAATTNPTPSTTTIGYRQFEHLGAATKTDFELPEGVDPASCIGRAATESV
jgi:hypothetical protein